MIRAIIVLFSALVSLSSCVTTPAFAESRYVHHAAIFSGMSPQSWAITGWAVVGFLVVTIIGMVAWQNYCDNDRHP